MTPADTPADALADPMADPGAGPPERTYEDVRVHELGDPTRREGAADGRQQG